MLREAPGDFVVGAALSQSLRAGLASSGAWSEKLVAGAGSTVERQRADFPAAQHSSKFGYRFRSVALSHLQGRGFLL